MKKAIIILCVVLVIAGTAGYFLYKTNHRKVADFDIFPCEFSASDSIEIRNPEQEIRLEKQEGRWRMKKPVEEEIDPGAAQELNRLLLSKVFIDDTRDLSQEKWEDFSVSVPTTLQFKHSDQLLCELELGRGYKLPTVNSERRWVMKDDKAYRIFIPLLDFGPIFEQPTAGWRNRIWLSQDTNALQSLKFWSGEDEFLLDRHGKRDEDNPQGWQLVSGHTPNGEVDASNFVLDDSRIATIINLLTPLSVEDWADTLTEYEKLNFRFGGTITFETESDKHTLYIGQETDVKEHPELAWIGEGARYIRLDNDERIGVMDVQHLLGLYPSLNDIRTKKIWTLDTTRFSGIETTSGKDCLRYGPSSSGDGSWSAQRCKEDQASDMGEIVLKPTILGNYLKALTSLEAFRYATHAESQSSDTNFAEIRIYEGIPEKLTTRLKLSAERASHFRYAQVIHEKDNGEEIFGPVFVISEALSRLILEDLRTR